MSEEALSPAPPAAALERTDSALKLRLYVMMFLQYFVQGCYLPVISVYAQDALGFNEQQIGNLGTALAIGPLLAPLLIGQLVDRRFATEKVLAASHAISGVLMIVLFWLTAYWPVIVVGILYTALYFPTMMLTNSLAFCHLKDREREFPPIRMWGTIGFIVPAWLIEPLFLSGLEGDELAVRRGIVLVFSGVSGLLMAAYSLTLPKTPPPSREKTDIAPARVLGLLRLRSFLVLVVVTLLIAFTHKFFFVWNSPYLKDILAIGEVTAWEQRVASIGQVFEILVMLVLGLAVTRLGFKRTMIIGAAAYLLRCLILALAISLDAGFGVVLALVCIGQALHGACFGCFLAAAYMYVDRVAPRDVRGSMQNFYGVFVIGVGFVIAGVSSGRIGDVFSTRTDQPGTQTVRERLGISSQAGMVRFEQKAGEKTVPKVRDWPGIWLSSAVVAAVALLGLWLCFPGSEGRPLPEGPSETAADIVDSS